MIRPEHRRARIAALPVLVAIGLASASAAIAHPAAFTTKIVAARTLAATSCRLKQPCKNDGTIYRVTRAATSTKVTGNHGATATTGQAFVTVRVRLFNTRLKQHDVAADDFDILGSDGKRYGPSPKTLDLNGDGKPSPTFFPPGFSQYMGPHHTASVVLLFEVPRLAAHRSILEVGSAGAKAAVSLGL